MGWARGAGMGGAIGDASEEEKLMTEAIKKVNTAKLNFDKILTRLDQVVAEPSKDEMHRDLQTKLQTKYQQECANAVEKYKQIGITKNIPGHVGKTDSQSIRKLLIEDHTSFLNET